MAWFGFTVCGENYMIKFDDGSEALSGFYIHKYIEAETFEIARVLVLEEVRNDEHLIGLIVDGGKSNPRLFVDKAYDYDTRPKHLNVELGDQPEDIYWEFFPMNEENENE